MTRTATLVAIAASVILAPAARADWVTPDPAQVLVGSARGYRPLVETVLGREIAIEVPVSLFGRVEDVSAFPIDRDGTLFRSGVVLAPVARLGMHLDTGKALRVVNLRVSAEADLPTGYYSTEAPPAGAGYPNGDAIGPELREAQARIAFGPALHVGGGFRTLHWGLGLVANDGAHGWEPGSARFTDPRGGDRVLGGYVGTGPLTRLHFVAQLAAEQVRGDELLLAGDSAAQFTAAAMIGYGGPFNVGVFVVHRRQQSIDGLETNATASDLAGHAEWALAHGARFLLDGEAVLVSGTTALGGTPDVPVHDVLELGAALRAQVQASRFAGVIDFLYASGDQNFDDRRTTTFTADPNYEMGLLLFRYVRAAQFGRAVATAGDPMLVGQPPPGLERVPTRGSIGNTIAFFPRINVRPTSGLEVYTGPLIAFAAVDNADPLNTQIAGGTARNALGGAPGRYYGTELDTGVRYRALLAGSELTLGLEGGVLLPGSALEQASGVPMGAVIGGRALLQYRL